jgi:hypothetical protein
MGLVYDTNDINSRDCPSNGSWTSSNEVNKLHIQPELIFTDLLLHPMLYSRNGIGRIGYPKARIRDKKSQDNYAEVGSFRLH